MPNPSDLRVGVIRIEGTNCEDESAAAFSSLGCNSEKVHLKQLLGEVEKSSCRNIMDYDALYFPGGFSSKFTQKYLKQLYSCWSNFCCAY